VETITVKDLCMISFETFDLKGTFMVSDEDSSLKTPVVKPGTSVYKLEIVVYSWK